MSPLIPILATLLIMVGATLLIHTFLSALAHTADALSLRRQNSRQLARLSAGEEEHNLADEQAASLLKPAPFPVIAYVLAGGVSLLGYILSSNLFSLVPLALVAAARFYADARHRARLADESYDFLLRLRMQLALKGSLMPALHGLAAEGGSIPAKVVGIYLNAGELDGVRVLQRAANAGVPYLGDLALRAGMTRGASLSMDRAVAEALDDLRADLDADKAERAEAQPAHMIVLVFPLLLGPALILLLYPVVNSVLETLSAPALIPLP
mgnify:CR=1 FL=1